MIANDIPSNYSNYTDTILHDPAFANSESSLGRSSRAACYLVLLGSVLLAVSLVVLYVWFRPLTFGGLGSLAIVLPSVPILYICGPTWAFSVSTSAAVLATVSVLTGSVIWAAMIKKVKDVNPWTHQPGQLPLGIEVLAGSGLHSTRLVSGLLLASIAPLVIESASFFRLIPTTPSTDRLCFDVA